MGTLKTGRIVLTAGLLAALGAALHPFIARAETYEELVAVAPREVISIECKGSLVTISVPRENAPKVISYEWTGTRLKAEKPRPPPKGEKR